jgi:hypothetical protein
MSVIYRAFSGLAALSAASTATIDLAAFAAAGGDLSPPRCTCPNAVDPSPVDRSSGAIVPHLSEACETDECAEAVDSLSVDRHSVAIVSRLSEA